MHLIFIKNLTKKTTSETKEKIKKVLNIEDVKFDKRSYRTPKERPIEKTGSGLTILPSDPNALIKRFDLLLASQNAGHSGVRNELVSIFDELKRQGVINTNTYKQEGHDGPVSLHWLIRESIHSKHYITWELF